MALKLKSVKDLVKNAKSFSIDTNLKEGAARKIVNKRLIELEDKYKTLTSKKSKTDIENAKKTIIDKFKELYNKEFYQNSYLPIVPRRNQKPNNSKNKPQTSTPSTTFQLKPDFFSPTQPSVRLPKSFVERLLVTDNMKLDFYTPWARPRNILPGRTTRETIYLELTKLPVRENVEVERLKLSIEQPVETPVNASAPPLDINSVPRLFTKNKGLRLAARNRLFLNKYGDDLLKGIKWGAGLGVIGGGIGGFWRVATNTYRKIQDGEPRLLNIINTPVKSNNTNLKRTPSNNLSDSTLSSTQNTSLTNTSNTSLANTTPTQNNTSNASLTNTSTLKNTSRTTLANTSNRNIQTTSNKLPRNISRNTSNNKSNTTSRKKLISKAQVKKAFADEFKKAYQNATTGVDNSSTRDYYSEALDMKSQLDKQRKDEVAKLLLQVLSLLNQLNQLTNPIY